MKKFILFLLFLNFLTNINTTFSQGIDSTLIYYEAPLEFVNGKTYSNQVTIQVANDSVIPYVDMDDIIYGLSSIPNTYSSLKQIISYYLTEENLDPEGIVFYRSPIDVRLPYPNMKNIFTVTFPGMVNVTDMVNNLLSNANILQAQHPHAMLLLGGVPFSDLGVEYNSSNFWDIHKIQAPNAWVFLQGASEEVVGVLETKRALYSHPEFNGHKIANFIDPSSLDYSNCGLMDNHATWVASVIASAPNTNYVLQGPGPGPPANQGTISVGFDKLKVSSHGFCPPNILPNGILNGMYEFLGAVPLGGVTPKILSLSFVWISPNLSYTEWNFVPRNAITIYMNTIQNMMNDPNYNTMIFAGTGNEIEFTYGALPYNLKGIGYPFGEPGVIGVGATGLENINPFQGLQYPGEHGFGGYPNAGEEWNYNINDPNITEDNGGYLDIVAPGWEINVADNDYINPSAYIWIGGTSLSTPITAAVAGSVFAVNQNLSKQQVENILLETADKVLYNPNGLTKPDVDGGLNSFLSGYRYNNGGDFGDSELDWIMGKGRVNMLSSVMNAAGLKPGGFTIDNSFPYKIVDINNVNDHSYLASLPYGTYNQNYEYDGLLNQQGAVVRFDGTGTGFTIKANATFRIFNGTKLEINNNSTLLMESGTGNQVTKLVIEDGGELKIGNCNTILNPNTFIEVKNNGKLVINDGSFTLGTEAHLLIRSGGKLEVKGSGIMTVSSDSYLCIEDQADVFLQTATNIITIASNVINGMSNVVLPIVGSINCQSFCHIAYLGAGFVNFLNPPVIVSISTTDACSYDEGTATASVSGGTPPYTIQWYNVVTGPIGTGQTVTFLTEGNYSVIATDANGCAVTQNFTINNTLNLSMIDYPNGLTITTNNQSFADQNGDGVIIVKGPVFINSGVNYTISNKIIEFVHDPQVDPTGNFGIPKSGIVVKNNAKLTLNNNALLKGLSGCNSMWEGVQVWGDPAQLIKNNHGGIAINENSLQNGKLVMNNAQIQDAHVGVRLYRSHDPFTIQPQDYGRGIVEATASRFINNRVGVGFSARTLKNNNSFITNCIFTCNAPLIGQVYNGEGSSIFISINNVKTIPIKANTFNANTSFAEDKRGTGIYSYNASYKVESATNLGNGTYLLVPKQNVFNGLTKGIDAHATGGVVTNITVRQNTFTNNTLQGITIQSANFGEIHENTFIIPAQTGALSTYGVYALNAKGYKIHNNNFNGTGLSCYGVVAQNTGSFGGEVKANNFTQLNIGTQTEEVNQALLIKCNNYTNNTGGFGIVVNPNTSGSLNAQGTGCASNQTQADNSFFIPNCTANKNHILSTIEFDYFNNPNTAGSPNPLCVGKTNGTNLNGFDDCIGSSIPAPLCNAGVSCVNPNCFQALISNTPDFVQKQLLSNELIRFYLNSNQEKKAIEVVEAMNTEEARKMLVPTYIEQRELQKADSTLGFIPVTGNENQDFHHLHNVQLDLYGNDKTLKEMSPAQKQSMETVANAGNKTSLSAQGILSATYQEQYLRMPQQLSSMKTSESNEEAVIPEGSIVTLETKVPNLTIAPNPFKDATIISYNIPEAFSHAEIMVTNLLGQQIELYPIKESGTGQVIFHTDKHNNHIYLCHFIIDGKRMSVTKLVVIK